MHRIESAQLLGAGAAKSAAFDIDEFILQEFGIRVGMAPLKLVLRIRGVLAKYLAENPVSADQVVAAIDAEWTRVRATVSDTIQLRTWLRSLGPDAVVEEPESLRAQLKREWEVLASLYGGNVY